MWSISAKKSIDPLFWTLGFENQWFFDDYSKLVPLIKISLLPFLISNTTRCNLQISGWSDHSRESLSTFKAPYSASTAILGDFSKLVRRFSTKFGDHVKLALFTTNLNFYWNVIDLSEEIHWFTFGTLGFENQRFVFCLHSAFWRFLKTGAKIFHQIWWSR